MLIYDFDWRNDSDVSKGRKKHEKEHTKMGKVMVVFMYSYYTFLQQIQCIL